MRKHAVLTWLTIAALLTGLLPASTASAPLSPVANVSGPGSPTVPHDLSAITLDGVRDADYVKIASDPSGDLGGPGGWTGTQWTDLTALYVAADETTLDAYADLPLYTQAGSAGQIGLVLDVDGKPNVGGASDPWGNAITFKYKTVDGATTPATMLPDYAVRGNIVGIEGGNGWTELLTWTGTEWGGSGTNWGGISGGQIGAHIAYSDTQGVEFAIPLADIGSPDPANVHLQLFATQEGGGKGAYDTIPSDSQSAGWDDPTTQYNLVSVPLATDPAGDLASPGPADWNAVHWTDMTRLHIWADNSNLHLFIPMAAYSQTLSAGQLGLAIDTKPGGGSGDPWGNGITYAYTSTWQNLGHTPVVTTTTILPDCMVRGNIFGPSDNGWTEFRTWNGSDWNTGGGTDWGGIGNSGMPSLPGSRVAWASGEGLRLTISLAQVGALAGDTINLEFLGTQGGGSKGAYDTVPSDDQTTGWDAPTTQRVLASYTIPEIPSTEASHDNVVWMDGLYHDTRAAVYRNPFGAVPAGTSVTLRLRAFKNDLTGARLRVIDDVLGNVSSYPMQLAASDGEFDYWEYTLLTDHATLLWYRFEAIDGTARAYYEDEGDWGNAPWTKGGTGIARSAPAGENYQLTVFLPGFTTPSWLKNGTIYQIFPDRFRNGIAANDVISGAFFYGDDEPWGTPPNTHTGAVTHTTWNEEIYDPRATGMYEGAYSNQFYGGDLQGVIDKLDYLRDAGFTVLYFNPIFASPSNHKYDGTTYEEIDPAFGDYATFTRLITETQARGMHVILDGVFNHTSSDSVYFDKYSRYPTVGAYESQTSPFYDWYFFSNWPENYTAWWGYHTLPKLNSANPVVRSYIYSGTDPIATRWIMTGSQRLASGWRFDVAGDIDPGYSNAPDNGYWIGFRQAVRSVYNETAMISEEWGNASQYLLGNQMDSTMNYRFRNALLGFVRDSGWSDTNSSFPHQTPAQFFETMRSIQEDYPAPAWYAMMNLVGSHDVNRARFVIRESGDVLETVDARQELMALAQYSLPGAPTVYYADEVGASADGKDYGGTNYSDPYNRLPFPWTDTPGFYTQRPGMLDYYTALGNARLANAALRTGSLDLLHADDENGTLAYGRRLGDEAAIAIFNRDATTQTVTLDLGGYLPIGTVLSDTLSDQVYTVAAVGTLVLPLQVTFASNEGALLVTTGVAAPPNAPTNLIATEGNGQVGLTWDVVAGASAYHVYRSMLSGAGYTRIATYTIGTPFTDSAVTNGTLYHYVVTALDGSMQESTYSNEASALPHADVGWANLQWPYEITHTIGLTPTENVYGQVFVSGVTEPPGAAPGLMAQLGYGPVGSDPTTWGTWVAGEFNSQAGNNDEFKAQLTPEAVGEFIYLWRYSTTGGRDWIYADRNGLFTGTPPNPGLLHVQAGSDTTAPDPPLNLRLAHWDVDHLTLAWNAPSAPDVYAYDLYRVTAAQPDPAVTRILSPTLIYTDDTVSSGVTYTYTVLALDGSFNLSLPSNAVSAMPQQRMVTVTFNVTVPTFTPADATICIPGDNAKIMGSTWTPSTLPMTKVDDTHWTKTIVTDDGTRLQYKYTRCSSWDMVEWWGDITGTANRQLSIEYGTTGVQVVNDTIWNWRDPLVVDKYPSPSGTTVLPGTIVWATWSRPLDGTTVNANTFQLSSTAGPVVGTVSYISQTNYYATVFSPTTALARGTTFTATLGTAIRGADNDGATLQREVVWSFMTEALNRIFLPIALRTG
jgi:glycosidase